MTEDELERAVFEILSEADAPTEWVVNATARIVTLATMKPDGHYWDHTSKEYREMLTPKGGPSGAA